MRVSKMIVCWKEGKKEEKEGGRGKLKEGRKVQKWTPLFISSFNLFPFIVKFTLKRNRSHCLQNNLTLDCISIGW